MVKISATSIKLIKIGGRPIQFELVEENQMTRFFDLDKYKSEWHKKTVGKYHLTGLLKCLLYYYFDFSYEIEETDLEKIGGMLVGTIFHKEIQDNIERKYGFSIIEYPVIDEFNLEVKLKKNGHLSDEKITLLAKADLLDVSQARLRDIKTTFYMPILEKLDDENFERNYGLYIIQVYCLVFFLNNTYFKIKPIESVEIILISKKNLYTKIIRFKYNEDDGKFFYLKLRERAKHLHNCLRNGEPPDAEINAYCSGCKYLKLCKKGSDFVAESSEPINFETNAFKQEYPDKKAYIRRNNEWIETKLFKDFKEKLKEKKEETK